MIHLKKEEVLIVNNTYEKFEYDRDILLSTTFSSGEVEKMALDLGAGTSLLIKNSGLDFIDTLTPVLSYGKNVSADHQKIKNSYYSIGTASTSMFRLNNAQLPVIPNFQASPCRSICGIWGADTFDKKVMIIRMQDSTLAVLDSLPSLDGWTKVEAKFVYPHFYVFVHIGEKKLKFLFDTGSTSSLVMNRKDFDKSFPEGCELISEVEKYYGVAFITGSGTVSDTARVAILDSIRIGDFPIYKTNLITSEKIRRNVLGMKVLEQFNILLDFPNEKLYFQRNPKYQPASAADLFVQKGFSLIVSHEGNLKVASLRVGFPAEKAGLSVGDIILSVNGLIATDGNNCNFIRLLKDTRSFQEKIEILVNRDGKQLSLFF